MTNLSVGVMGYKRSVKGSGKAVNWEAYFVGVRPGGIWIIRPGKRERKENC
jgi:hypothetical protein